MLLNSFRESTFSPGLISFFAFSAVLRSMGSSKKQFWSCGLVEYFEQIKQHMSAVSLGWLETAIAISAGFSLQLGWWPACLGSSTIRAVENQCLPSFPGKMAVLNICLYFIYWKQSWCLACWQLEACLNNALLQDFVSLTFSPPFMPIFGGGKQNQGPRWQSIGVGSNFQCFLLCHTTWLSHTLVTNLECLLAPFFFPELCCLLISTIKIIQGA